MGGDKEKETRLPWSKIMPSPLSNRYALVSGKNDAVMGIKVLCDSGYTEMAYNAVLMLTGRSMPIIVGHMDFVPEKCSLVEAGKLFDYEANTFIYVIKGYSARSQEKEVSCIIIDFDKLYVRTCTINEARKLEGWLDGGGWAS